MDTWLIIILVFAGIGAIIVIVMATINGHSKVECLTEIDAPVERAFEQVVELKNWPKWSPWDKMDPQQKKEYSDPSRGEGAWMKWDSKNKNVGRGKMTLSEVDENKHTKQTMEFEKWGTNSADMYFESVDDNKCTVRWVMENDMKGTMKFFKGMIEKQLNKSFNTGLAGIKEEAEKAQPQV